MSRKNPKVDPQDTSGDRSASVSAPVAQFQAAMPDGRWSRHPRSVSISAPIAPFQAREYRPRQLSLRLTQRQADALKCLYLGLHSGDTKLQSGRHVDTPANVVQWLLERVADGIDGVSA